MSKKNIPQETSDQGSFKHEMSWLLSLFALEDEVQTVQTQSTPRSQGPQLPTLLTAAKEEKLAQEAKVACCQEQKPNPEEDYARMPQLLSLYAQREEEALAALLKDSGKENLCHKETLRQRAKMKALKAGRLAAREALKRQEVSSIIARSEPVKEDTTEILLSQVDRYLTLQLKPIA